MAIADTGILHIDRLTGPRSWTGTTKQAATVTYNASLQTWAYNSVGTKDPTSSETVFATNVKAFDTYEYDAASPLRAAMTSWSNVAKITFSASTSNNPDFVIRKADTLATGPLGGSPTKPAFGVVSDMAISGSTLLKQDMFLKSDQLIGAVEGSDRYNTLVHELGHVLGLTDIDNIASGYNHSTTIMSYNTYNGLNGFMPMLYDIAAAQYLYGTNTTYRNTATTYGNGADSATNVHISGDAKLWTVWDAGGTDTFDFSNVSAASSGAKIDLRGGVDAANDNLILFKKAA